MCIRTCCISRAASSHKVGSVDEELLPLSIVCWKTKKKDGDQITRCLAKSCCLHNFCWNEFSKINYNEQPKRHAIPFTTLADKCIQRWRIFSVLRPISKLKMAVNLSPLLERIAFFDGITWLVHSGVLVTDSHLDVSNPWWLYGVIGLQKMFISQNKITCSNPVT